MASAHVLVVGVSTRAAAASAGRAGFRVTSIDGFADLDQHPSVRALSITRDFGGRFTAAAVARAARGVDADAVVYLSPFENHPVAVARLARDRMLWGNRPETLRRVRNPLLLAESLRRRGFKVPTTFRPSHSHDPNARNDPNDFLVKPLASGGGAHIRPWRPPRPVPRRSYVQRRVHGSPGSVVFVAARGRAVPLGVSRQIVGDPAFGASGYRYCGSILAPPGESDDDRLTVVSSAITLAGAVADEFGLVGVNGVDFVEQHGEPVALEVNPRWSASMELAERAFGRPLFAVHADACVTGELPALPVAQSASPVLGKAIVFARTGSIVGDTEAWLEDPDVRDVPRRGERIAAGHPVCTVLAAAATAAECHDALAARAARVYATLVPDGAGALSA
ncbi:MAG TPA: ATP-grasp domain-containing protein [Vicinamibacterales bacterium]|nr:ATP-grasp domain-containing protein [Vicinamibacterales bacterium]